LFPAVLLGANLFVFGPFTIYSGNWQEFSIPLYRLLLSYAIPFAALVAFLLAVVLVSGKRAPAVGWILVAIGGALWLQQNFLVWDYGLLDGRPIDWATLGWRGWIDGSLWVAILLGAAAVRGRRARLATSIALGLLGLQCLAMTAESVRRPEVWKAHLTEYRSLETSDARAQEIFAFSNEHNVIHIILDSMQSDVLAEILRKDRPFYRSKLRGFTFFADCLAAFPVTWPSILAILSGETYENGESRFDFEKRILEGPTVGSILGKHGYEVDVANWRPHYMSGEVSRRFVIDQKYGLSAISRTRYEAAELMDLVVFRSAPHLLKRSVYNDQLWQIRRWISQPRRIPTFHFGGKYFLDDLTRAARVRSGRPAYKYFHFVQSHGPPVFDENCEYLGEALPSSRANMERQSTCVIRQAVRLLDSLRRLGVYDSSTIVIQSDHGGWLPVRLRNDDQWEGHDTPRAIGAALPVLLVKPRNSTTAFVTSKAPVSLTDVQATILDLEGLENRSKGTSAFRVPPDGVRERRFHFHEWSPTAEADEYIDRIDVYRVLGPATDRRSWSLESTLFPPGARMGPGEIDLGKESALAHLSRGWSSTEHDKTGETYVGALGEKASIFTSVPPGRACRLRARVKLPPDSRSSLEVRVLIDGVPVGIWNLSPSPEWQETSAFIPAAGKRPAISKVEFAFSHHLEATKGGRPLALLFDWIRVDPVD
jgi:hypothetical protein